MSPDAIWFMETLMRCVCEAFGRDHSWVVIHDKVQNGIELKLITIGDGVVPGYWWGLDFIDDTAIGREGLYKVIKTGIDHIQKELDA